MVSELSKEVSGWGGRRPSIRKKTIENPGFFASSGRSSGQKQSSGAAGATIPDRRPVHSAASHSGSHPNERVMAF